MFGGSLRQAWPYAAVALHYLDGFGERFERAATAAETLFQALHRHSGCEVRRPAAATNVTRLRVFGADAESLPERLLARGITIRPALHAFPEGAEFELFTNETILCRPANEILEIFVEALEILTRPSVLTLSDPPLNYLAWHNFRSLRLPILGSRSRRGRYLRSTTRSGG